MISKNDYELEWNNSTIEIHRKVMGLYTNVFSRILGKRLKILSTEPIEENYQYEISTEAKKLLRIQYNQDITPGEVISCE